jgi:hypothetical protein
VPLRPHDRLPLLFLRAPQLDHALFVLYNLALFLVAPGRARRPCIVYVLRKLDVRARSLLVEFPDFSDAGVHFESLKVRLVVEDPVVVRHLRPDVARGTSAGMGMRR